MRENRTEEEIQEDIKFAKLFEQPPNFNELKDYAKKWGFDSKASEEGIKKMIELHRTKLGVC